MNQVQKNVLKSLRDRIDLAKKKIESDEQDIIYQKEIIREAEELIGQLKINDKDEE